MTTDRRSGGQSGRCGPDSYIVLSIIQSVAGRQTRHRLPDRLSGWWRLDVYHRVDNLRMLRHQAVLHDMREAVCFAEWQIGRQPDVEIEEDVIGGAAGANLM